MATEIADRRRLDHRRNDPGFGESRDFHPGTAKQARSTRIRRVHRERGRAPQWTRPRSSPLRDGARHSAPPPPMPGRPLRRLGGQLLGPVRLLGADLDRARLQRLGDLAHQFDAQQAVGHAGTVDADVVGELEPALKGAAGNAAMQEHAVLFIGLGPALDRQGVLLGRDLDIVRAEAGDRHGDAIVVLAQLFDIVGRVAGTGLIGLHGGIHQPRDAVEADSRAKERREVEGTHSHPPDERRLRYRLPPQMAVKSPASAAAGPGGPDHRRPHRIIWQALPRFQEGETRLVERFGDGRRPARPTP